MEKKNKKDFVIVEGVVTEVLTGLKYKVMVEYQGIEFELQECYVAGKMRKNFIQIEKGDRVKVEISLYDINKGRIVYRLTERKSGDPQLSKTE
ncbi:MAG: translation initiation factor IF-1 [Candidatus Dojkabacteria bacterium]|nr:MAG: translation initiation factor IF-1 [Candidatus Dojkabacteria bacterium]